MKNIIFYISVAIFLLNAPNSSAQVFSWAQGITGTGSGSASGERVQTATTDASGNIYSIGYFHGTADFDATPGIYNLTAVSNLDMFIMKEDSTGNLIWVKQVAGLSSGGYGCMGRGVDVDQNGNVFIMGTFRDSFDFDPGVPTYKLYSYGGYHSFVLKLDSFGNFLWVGDMGSQYPSSNISLMAAKRDKANNIYFVALMAGNGTTPMDIDPTSGVYNIIANPGDLLLEKLDSNGNLVWAKQINGAGYGAGINGLALDSSSYVYITGGFKDTVDFDPGTGVSKLFSGSSTGSAIFVAKYDSLGNFFWVKQVGVAGNYARSQGISVDPSGNVLVTGSFGGPLDFDPGSGVYTLTAASTLSAFTIKLKNNGDFVWAKMMGAPIGLFSGGAIATDSAGYVYTAAMLPSGCDMDPSPDTYYVNGGVAIQKLDSAGNFVWASSWEGEIPSWIGLDNSNNIYTTGVFTGTNRDFNPGSGTFLLSGSNSGSGFILKLSQQSIIDNIEEHEHFQQGVKVYPNPSTGILTFSSSEKIDLITITDLQGKVVFTQRPNTIKTTVNLSQLSSGMYLYTLTHGQKRLNGNFILETTR